MILTISTWWQALGGLEKVFWIIAFPTSILFIVQLIMTFSGGGEHDTPDSHDEAFSHDDTLGSHILTIRNTIAFFTIFAWSGIAFLGMGLGNILTVLFSILCGILMMLVLASIYYGMSKLSHSGTMKMQNAVGQVGEVYITIPSNKKGTGQVQVKVQGTLRTLDAMTEEDVDLPSRTIIIVSGLVTDNILLVQRN